MLSWMAPFAVAAQVAAGVAAGPQAEIMAAMNASAAGWNTGSLDRFMSVYAADAVFVGKDGLVNGRAAIAARYRPSFADGANRRGRLSFEPLGFRRISGRHQLLWARWRLTPAAGPSESGVTTLLFERRAEGWRIVSDHSS
jgi:uncharacterized protein (TIGR02246 family)